MGQTRAQRVIKELAGSVQKQTAIATDMFIPNHSGDNSAGDILKTPVNDTDIPNKKYVDDTIPLHDYGTEGSVAFLDANGRIDEENSEIFWDSVNKRMGLGTATTDRLYKLKIKQKAGEGGIWLENPAGNYGAYFIDNTNGIFKTQTQLGMAFRSQTGYVYFKSASHVYFDVGDALGVNEFKFRNRYGAEIAVLDSLGNLSVVGNVGIGTDSPNAKLQVVGDTHLGADTTNYTEIKTDGEINLHGTARVTKTKTFTFNYARITGQGKPTLVNRGVFFGWSLPIFNSDDEELYSCSCAPTDWDGVTDPVFSISGWLDTANTDKKFNMQISVETYDPNTNEVVPITTNDISVETDTGTAAQYTSFIVPFTLDASAIDFNASEPIGIRIRRLDASENEIAGEFVVEGAVVSYVSNKLGEAT